VPAIERALRDTAGDIPAKLMAGMQAARLAGGDRRCSCPPKDNPTGCGCPPRAFDKSGHRGGMLVARIGDLDGTEANGPGSATGSLFMRLSVTYRGWAKGPDPVVQLQKQFDEWRASLVGHPDAIQSLVEATPPTAGPDGVRAAKLLITLRDWRGRPITTPVRGVTVTHAPDSARSFQITDVTDNGNGSSTVTLMPGKVRGVDRFVVTVDDGARPVVLMPNPSLQYAGRQDSQKPEHDDPPHKDPGSPRRSANQRSWACTQSVWSLNCSSIP
jgi:hypothetical protein